MTIQDIVNQQAALVEEMQSHIDQAGESADSFEQLEEAKRNMEDAQATLEDLL